MQAGAHGYRFPRARTLVFAKAPVPGACKTRLIPALGAAGAAALHRALLDDTIARLAPARLAPMQLWCAPTSRHPVFQTLAARFGVALHTQVGGDLGARLLRATADALAQAEAVALIGCDCPMLSAEHLAEAFAALEEPDVDAVLGPADDGGYVLLALRRAAAELFQDMAWGGSSVAALTRRRMSELGWHWRELASLPDVDRPEDLPGSLDAARYLPI
jgi:rSAM/selenodomain-associated transferase 1